MTDDGVTECDVNEKKISVFTMRIILIYTQPYNQALHLSILEYL
jgi:hypothetical protein